MLFDVDGDMDRFNIFNIGATGSLAPVQKLVDRLALEAQGLHTIMWKWCPSDTYTQVGEIWNGPHPEDGRELEAFYHRLL
jgi:hypothetical protein